jgi:hypothetical protein
VVYSLTQKRVWLVSNLGKVTRTYAVTPGTLNPSPGTYTVGARSAIGIGGDGVPIEHTVLFTSVNGVSVGFSAAQNGSLPKRGGTQKTGGIRETRADGTALWDFTLVGTKIVVVA